MVVIFLPMVNIFSLKPSRKVIIPPCCKDSTQFYDPKFCVRQNFAQMISSSSGRTLTLFAMAFLGPDWFMGG